MKLNLSSILVLALALVVDSSTAGAQPKKLRPLTNRSAEPFSQFDADLYRAQSGDL